MWIGNQDIITYVKKKPSDNYDAYKFWELTEWKENFIFKHDFAM